MDRGLSSTPRAAYVSTPDGVFMRCPRCGNLLKFLIRYRDGRDLCKRCAEELDASGPIARALDSSRQRNDAARNACIAAIVKALDDLDVARATNDPAAVRAAEDALAKARRDWRAIR